MTNITRSDAQVSRRVSQHLMTYFAHLPLNLFACTEGRRRSAGSSVLCAREIRPEDLSILWSGEWGLQMFFGGVGATQFRPDGTGVFYFLFFLMTSPEPTQVGAIRSSVTYLI